jgi:hypothetical protein
MLYSPVFEARPLRPGPALRSRPISLSSAKCYHIIELWRHKLRKNVILIAKKFMVRPKGAVAQPPQKYVIDGAYTHDIMLLIYRPVCLHKHGHRLGKKFLIWKIGMGQVGSNSECFHYHVADRTNIDTL